VVVFRCLDVMCVSFSSTFLLLKFCVCCGCRRCVVCCMLYVLLRLTTMKGGSLLSLVSCETRWCQLSITFVFNYSQS